MGGVPRAEPADPDGGQLTIADWCSPDGRTGGPGQSLGVPLSPMRPLKFGGSPRAGCLFLTGRLGGLNLAQRTFVSESPGVQPGSARRASQNPGSGDYTRSECHTAIYSLGKSRSLPCRSSAKARWRRDLAGTYMRSKSSRKWNGPRSHTSAPTSCVLAMRPSDFIRLRFLERLLTPVSGLPWWPLPCPRRPRSWPAALRESGSVPAEPLSWRVASGVR